MTRELEVFFLSCHNIGRGLNEVVRKVLVEYDAGLIPYESAFRILQQCVKSVYCCDGNEYEATVCMYDRCGRCLHKGMPMFQLGVLYDNQEVLERVREAVIDYHLCQDCIDKLEIQEFVDSPWDVEKHARYDYYG